MPDYGFNYNLGPQAKQTNLSDMLNMAGSAQNLQQNMQMNPLQVQQAQQLLRQQQLTTQKAEALNPQEITTGRVKLEEEAKQAPIKTKEDAFAYYKKNSDRAMQLMTGFLRDPAIANAVKNPEGAAQVINQMNTLLLNGGVDESIAKQHMNEIMNVAKNHPEKLANVLQNIGAAATTSEAQQGRRTPQLTTTAGGAPATYTAESGMIGAPTIQGQQPQGQQQQVGEPAMQAPQQQLPKIGGVSLAYPIRKAGDLRPLDPSETADKDSQIADRQSLAKRQKALTAAEDTSEKIFKTLDKMEAETIFKGGSVAARAERLVNKFINNEENQRLAKLLANETIANAKTLGVADSSGNVSVAGLNMQAVASGNTENVTPDVLREVARFNQANRMNIDLQAKAKEAFSKQYGDANGRTFDQVWRNNSNNTLFEALAIDKSKMPYKEKQAAYKKLFEGLSPEDLADFKNKKANIDAMVNGNFAGVK